jgi:DNA helicase-2/ATP-dependent DNA helicase PcrA
VSDFQPRQGQREVLAYTGGRMGISAVPGSGKTRTLAELAAVLIAERIDDGQEVLVVTLVNAAVDNFRQQINEAIKKRRLLPNYGYRVRTLHGLAHDIVRERPGLVGLAEDFGIIDERESDTIRQAAADAWLHAHPESLDAYLPLDADESRAEWLRGHYWPRLVRGIATAVIKQAKDLQRAPGELLETLAERESALLAEGHGSSLALARLGIEVYADYQRSLAYRGVVDFDDLIRLALRALKLDEGYLARLRERWPYVLEDEAQDSSRLQEEILRLLVGEQGNWVRVGDTNQAIYDTFTNADPRFLRSFVEEEQDVISVELPESGRSQPIIFDLANHLVDWTRDRHPTPQVHGAFMDLHIKPTGLGDPQPNPPRNPAAVQIVDRDFASEAELRAVADSLESWLPDHPDWTVAVLTPLNRRGFDLIEVLKHRGIPHVEILRSTSATRQIAGALGNLLHCLADPTSAKKLSVAFQVWRRDDRDDQDAWALVEAATAHIRRCQAVEAYLWPRAENDWLASLSPELGSGELDLLQGFREIARHWHRAAALPIDQLVLTLAGDLFDEPADLALSHKLAGLLRDVARAHPAYRLPELVQELAVVARNERRFLGFSREDSGFKPPKGEVTVTTMHKAKGLEWDRVYLLSANNYDFPSGLDHDTYISEPWYLRDKLNLQAESLAQLQWIAREPDAEDRIDLDLPLREGEATHQARLAYVSERLRLFYVGITRAKKDLIITWNRGRRPEAQPSVPFVELHDYWQEHHCEEPESNV